VQLPGISVPPWSLALDRAVMGIDPSTRRMSAAVLVPAAERCNARGEVAFVVDTRSLPQPECAARRLAEERRTLYPWLRGLLTTWQPEVAVVEQPFAQAKHVPPVSYYALGVLLELLGAFGGVRVEMIQPSSWKRLALGAGKGGVKKPKRGSSEEYEVLRWARDAGYEGSLWDEADAIGIATAGGVLLERERAAA
jgi:Holliday junction resolvasome RuvABC endonuclease subunit